MSKRITSNIFLLLLLTISCNKKKFDGIFVYESMAHKHKALIDDLLLRIVNYPDTNSIKTFSYENENIHRPTIIDTSILRLMDSCKFDEIVCFKDYVSLNFKRLDSNQNYGAFLEVLEKDTITKFNVSDKSFRKKLWGNVYLVAITDW